MSYEFDTTAAIFDRADLRVLCTAYARAHTRLEATRLMDADAKAELARLVVHLGRERSLDGIGLRYRDADESIADDASSFLDELHGVPLVA